MNRPRPRSAAQPQSQSQVATHRLPPQRSEEPATPSLLTPRAKGVPGSHSVYGIHAVTELLRKRRDQVHALFVLRDAMDSTETTALTELCKQAANQGLRAIEKNRGELDRLSQNGVHQGVVALTGEFRYADSPLDLLKQPQEAGVSPLVVILDGVTDPQNLGALVRSTYCMGGHGVLIPQDRAVGVTPATIKASAGATELLPIALCKNLVRAMEELKEAGLWMVAAVAPGQDGQAPWDCDLTVPMGLVLGSEGRGLRPLVRKTCDLRVEVPMAYGLHGASLNVSVAGAVLLYEALRQKTGPASTTPTQA